MAGTTPGSAASGRWKGRKSAKAPAARPRADRHSPAALADMIEGEIIPRLLLAHSHSSDPAAATSGSASVPDDAVAALARVAIDDKQGDLVAYVEAVRASGVSFEVVFTQLMAPAARLLGEWWEQDRCDFIDVTHGLGRLRRALLGLSPAFKTEGGAAEQTPRALFAPAPGEQHSFGVAMAATFFRRAGWEVWDEPASTSELLQELVETQWFEIVGLSLSSDSFIEPVAETIDAIRRCSRNHFIKVMLGGSALQARPDLAARVGADLAAADAQEAVVTAQGLFEGRALRI